MHIPNNENKGIREVTLWKTFWKGEENIRHKFSRAMARKGLLEVGNEEVNGKGGRILVGFGRAVDRGALNQMSIVYKYWQGSGHDAYGDRGKHLVVITSELVGVGQISNPV